MLSAVCCVGRSCCDLACCCCKECFHTVHSVHIKIAYMIMVTLNMLFSIFLLYWIAHDILNHFTRWVHCPKNDKDKLSCLGLSASYRMSLSLASLFFLIFLSQLTKNSFAKWINEGMWFFKLAYIIGIFIALMYISNSFFEDYAKVAKYIGGIFTLFQIIMLIDLFWIWGENWVTYYDKGQQVWRYILIVTALILYGGAIAFIVVNFVWFGKSGCGTNIVLIVINIVMVIIMTGITVSGIVKGGSLITAGAISIYITYLTFSALSNRNSDKCNHFYKKDSIITAEIIFNIFLLIVWMSYFSVVNQKVSSRRLMISKNLDINSGLLQAENKTENSNMNNLDEEQKKINEEQDSKEEYQSNKWIYYHILMTFAAVHISNMLTNWGSPKINSKNAQKAYKPNDTAFWIKLLCSYGGCLIYLWTCIAPRIFKNREFIQDF